MTFAIFLTTESAKANHIYGGDFSITSLGNNRYNLTLHLYYDESQTNVNALDPTVRANVFRKRDNRFMNTAILGNLGQIVLTRVSVTPFSFKNKACADAKNLKVSDVMFSREIVLAPNQFNDPGGYYVIWDRCCRNVAVNNLVSPGTTPMSFLLEFPAVTQNNGQPFINSSPRFSRPDGDYICLNKPFQYNMSATDGDGDELRYSLITPVAGFTTTANPTDSDTIGRWPYPNIRWQTGYNATNAIRGPQPLTIDGRTGILTVTANELGLFAFAVLIEEYRNGVRIGATRREFQLPVIDCSNTPPPVPIIYKDPGLMIPVTVLELCEGASANLYIKTDPAVENQWQRNGTNIPNETSGRISVSQLGDYQVVANYNRICSNDTVSGTTRVVRGLPPNARLTPTDTLRICEGDSGTITATAGATFGYQWTFNNQSIANATTNTLKVKQRGSYAITVRQSSNECLARDTVFVTTTARPLAPLMASKTTICPNDSARLNTNYTPPQTVEWYQNNVAFRNNSNSYFTKQAGVYRVRISNGLCSTWSDTLRIRLVAAPNIMVNSPSVCLKDTILPLTATPAGGTFTLNGMMTTNINIRTLGIGKHTIDYQLRSPEGCVFAAMGQVTVNAPPMVTLPPQIDLVAGASVQLSPKVDAQGYTYVWRPPYAISNTTVQNPVVSPLTTTTYTVTVTNQNGCKATASILVDVVTGIYVPTIFTPNNDARNDFWEIKNIDKYPETEVFVYSRWGELVFYSKGYKQPWDGTYLGKPASPGVYTFLINTNLKDQPMRGSIVLSR